MKNFVKLLSALAITVVAGSANAVVADYADGEIVVKFRSTAGATTIAAIHQSLGSQVIEIIPRINVQRVRLSAGTTVESALSFYRGRTAVQYAEPNYRKHLTFTPNDPQFNSMWGMSKIKMPLAWDLGKGSPTVVAAVIDTGIDLNHEDFAGKLVPGFDFSDNDSDPTFSDSHGVHTAGTVGAATNNGKGVVGVGFNCKVMPLKIFPQAFATTSANAIIYAADKGAKVVSMSYGSYGSSQVEKDATDYAWSKGVVLVGGAGNDNTSTPFYPNSFPKVIGVGSTDPTDQKSGFSNFGADHVMVAAPGENILSTFPGNTYAAIDGTSMACPHVAGLAALLFSFAPSGTSAQAIRNAIEQNTDPVGNWLKFGRINAQKAMKVFDVLSEDVSVPIAISPFLGTNPSGDITSVLASDALWYSLNSVPSAPGQIAADVVTLGVTVPVNNLRSAKLIFEATAPAGTSNQIYLWNYNTLRWDVSRASALKPVGPNRVTISLPANLTPFVFGGEMKILTRGIRPSRPMQGTSGIAPQFVYNVGFMQLRTRSN
jgi:thermitase